MLNHLGINLITMSMYLHIILFLTSLTILDAVKYRNKNYNWFFNRYRYGRLKLTLIWLIIVIAFNYTLIESCQWFRDTLVYNTFVASSLMLIIWWVVILYALSSQQTKQLYSNWTVMDFSCINILWYSFLYSLVLVILYWGYLHHFTTFWF